MNDHGNDSAAGQSASKRRKLSNPPPVTSTSSNVASGSNDTAANSNSTPNSKPSLKRSCDVCRKRKIRCLVIRPIHSQAESGPLVSHSQGQTGGQAESNVRQSWWDSADEKVHPLNGKGNSGRHESDRAEGSSGRRNGESGSNSNASGSSAKNFDGMTMPQQPWEEIEDDNVIAGTTKAKIRCEGCKQIGLECTYEQERKRRGRPNSFLAQARKNSIDKAREMESPPSKSKNRPPSAGRPTEPNQSSSFAIPSANFLVPSPPQPMPGHPMAAASYYASSASHFSSDGSLAPLPSALRSPRNFNAPRTPGPAVHFDAVPIMSSSSSAEYGFPPVASTSSNPSSGMTPGSFVGPNHQRFLNEISPGNDSELNALSAESWSASDIPIESYENSHARNPYGPGPVITTRVQAHPIPESQRPVSVPRSENRLRAPNLQVEDVCSWSTLSFFMSLYIRHLHALVPLVHKPTFSQALTMRLDQRDVGFRAFLFSLMTYVICQSPMSRMISRFTQDELEHLQKKAHRASQQLQDRRYRNPSVLQIATLICDSYLHAACDRPAQTAAVLGEAIQLTYVTKLHDEAHMQASNLNCIELELRRRLFWHLHAIDITWASAGMPLHMNDFEGVPNYPLMVDDEYITAQGAFEQPQDQTSYLVGFVSIAKMFRILAECIFRNRRFNRMRRFTLSDRQEAANWIHEATVELDDILRELPDILRHPDRGPGPNSVSEEAASVYSMQTANLFVTAASINFALCDFKADVDPDSVEVALEREKVGKEMYHMLAGLSLDSLAANGESMRGKVLRIIMALGKNPEQVSDSLKNWWDMFSMIQFVQMIPYSLSESLAPSRAQSPLPNEDRS